MYDSLKTLNVLPPFTLGKSYHDFGTVMKMCDTFRTHSVTISIMNNLEAKIVVNWINSKLITRRHCVF